MLRPVATRPVLLLLGACLLAGCGDSGPTDEEQVRATLADFQRATEARDYEALCERILAPELIGSVEQIGLQCEMALEKAFEDVEDPQLTVGAVEVHDGRATAEVRSSAAGESPSQDTVELVRVGDGWRIASLAGQS
jgi:ketosteroid isomerase-like protein